jgi:hypothetical protein
MNIKLEKGSAYTDERGTIEMLVEDMPFSSISKITSKAGSIRANHIHFDDYHVCILTKGKMLYYERDAYSQDSPKRVEINIGDIFYTKPKSEHAMEFLQDSEFWCFSKNNRKQATYESDTVRLFFDLTRP